MRCAVDGGLEDGCGPGDLREEETIFGFTGIDTAGEVLRQAIHFAPFGSGMCDGEAPILHQERADPHLGAAKISEGGESAL